MSLIGLMGLIISMLPVSNKIVPHTPNTINKDQIDKFIILQTTQCMQQINNNTFIFIKDYIFKGDIYYGKVIYRDSDKLYVSLGYSKKLLYEIFIPVFNHNNESNITLFNN